MCESENGPSESSCLCVCVFENGLGLLVQTTMGVLFNIRDPFAQLFRRGATNAARIPPSWKDVPGLFPNDSRVFQQWFESCFNRPNLDSKRPMVFVPLSGRPSPPPPKQHQPWALWMIWRNRWGWAKAHLGSVTTRDMDIAARRLCEFAVWGQTS